MMRIRTANITPCIETMNPLDSGVEHSAWYLQQGQIDHQQSKFGSCYAHWDSRNQDSNPNTRDESTDEEHSHIHARRT